MKVYSINPNNGQYFEDKSPYLDFSQIAYQGMYNYTPVYPLYTVSTNNRFNYTSQNPEVEFVTMLPIKRLLSKYFVEVRLRILIAPFEKDSIPNAINEFHKFCEMNKKELDVNSLVKNNLH